MKMLRVKMSGVALIYWLLDVVSANQKCHGSPRMYNGKRCASTSNFHDGHKGACGCGPARGDSQFDWNKSGYVAAASQHLFDRNGGTWCGEACGRCVKLTTTGGNVPGQGSAPPEGQSHVFMITNLCPSVYPNLSWCSQTANKNNQYGYAEHFDLENGVRQITNGLGWNNPEVTWEWTTCDNGHRNDGRTPSTNNFHSCQCG